MNAIDRYIADFPEETQKQLQAIRKVIKKAAANAEEVMSYGIPTYKLNGNLVHFAGYKKHIGFYPTPKAIEAFKEALVNYKQSKGAVQFPLEKPLPLELIKSIVAFRVKENMPKTGSKKTLRTCENGHHYYKSSDCPACPVCEQEREPKDHFLSLFAAPARRALENKGITSVEQLAQYKEAEILSLHGMGPSSLPKLYKALATNGLTFKSE